jgi:flagellar protein FlbD
MVKLTKRDGSQIYINAEIIESIEETPDTHLTLLNGNRHLVCESAAEIIDKIVEFKASILHRALPKPPPARRPAAGQRTGCRVRRRPAS